MKIGINLLYLLPGVVGGTETYAAGLLHGLAEIDPRNEYVVFVNSESVNWPLPEAANFTRVVCPVRASRRASRYLFEQLRLPLLLSRYDVDVVHSLGYVGPLLARCPSMVTLHDVNYYALKKTMPFIKRNVLRFFSMQSARRAAHVMTISHFSKGEICRIIKLEPSKITVGHLGAGYGASNFSGDWAELTSRYNIRTPYVAAFGGGTLNKNMPRLIRAFVSVKDTFPHALVLIGHIPPDLDLTAETQEVRDRVIVTGYVPGEHILPLLSHAELFVIPSLYEGFGLPMLEAQQASVAVACSKAGSLPEVGGDGALYFDPTSVEQMADAIRHCLSDVRLRSQLISKGRENVSRFSWTQTAKETLSVYQRAVESRQAEEK
ncbi:MAG: glycosyltransferase family 1 protein [Deltaproteobacteria bacterium]|nr:glycosyltransferase family 1 protein [Deltaproteobacteria bacterium]